MPDLIRITVISDGQETNLELSSALVGGVMKDSGFPMGTYLGSLKFDETIPSMQHAIRSFLKTCEMQLDLLAERGLGPKAEREQRMKAMYDMLLKIAENAYKTELRNDPLDNISPDEHQTRVMTFRKDGKVTESDGSSSIPESD